MVKVFELNGKEIDVLMTNDVDVEFEGEFLMSGRQVAGVLGYSRPSRPIKRHVDEDDRIMMKNSDLSTEGFRNLNNRGETFLTERGVIQLMQKTILSSPSKKLEILDSFDELAEGSNIRFISTRNEIEFVDMLTRVLEPFDLPLIKQKRVGKYKVDVYIPKVNIVIEYDENGHKYYDDKEEASREDFIRNELGSELIRVNSNDGHGWNVGYCLKEIIRLKETI